MDARERAIGGIFSQVNKPVAGTVSRLQSRHVHIIFPTFSETP